MKKFNLYAYLEYLIGILVFIVYLLTSTRFVQDFFHGEFLIAQSQFGVPHPPGFPLYVILGWIFSFIAGGISEALKFSLLSSFYAAIGCVFFYKMVRLIFENFKAFSLGKLIKDKNFTELEIAIISLVSSLSLAFSLSYWTNAAVTNPFSLTCALLLISFYFALKAYLNVENANKFWIASALSLGLSASANLLAIFGLIPITYLFFKKFEVNDKNIASYAKLFSPAIATIAFFYAILFFRASLNSSLNYLFPLNFSSIIDFLTLRYLRIEYIYQYLVFSNNSLYFINNLISEYGIFLLMTILLGIFVLIFEFNELKILYLLNLITFFLIFTNLYIPDGRIDLSLLLFSLTLAAPFAYGFIVHYASKINSNLSIIIIFIPLTTFAANFKEANYANENNVSAYISEAIKPLENKRVIIAVRPMMLYWNLHYHENKNEIKNQATINPEALAFPYYIENLCKRLNKLAPISDSLKTILTKNSASFINRGLFTSSHLNETSLKNLSLLIRHLKKNDIEIYFTYEAFFDFSEAIAHITEENYDLVPYGLLFKFQKNDVYLPNPVDSFKTKINLTKRTNLFQKDLIFSFPFMLEMRALYEISKDNAEKANNIYRSIKKEYPYYIFVNEQEIKEYLLKKGFTL